MKKSALIYVPSDTPEATVLATMKVAGVPLIVRGVMTLQAAGIQRCTLLIASAQREKVESFLDRYKDKQLPEIRIISYDDAYAVTPQIVQTITEGIEGRMLLINSNLLFEKELISAITENELACNAVMLCMDGAHRIPMLDVSAQAFETLSDFVSERPRSIESCIAHLLGLGQEKRASCPRGSNIFLLRRLRDRAVAEKFLAEAIRHSTPGPVAKYINKRISLPISLFLAKLWISPHAITAVNIVIGLLSGVFVADANRYEYILFGAVLFQIASIVDGCDGEVAKLTFRCSKFGQYIDSLSDNLSLGSFMTGLIAGYWRETHSYVAFAVGAVMIFSTAITFFWMVRYLARNTQSASLATFDKAYLSKLSSGPKWLLIVIRYGKYTLKKDVFSFMFLIFAIAGVLYWWLFIAAFGTTVAALILTYLKLREHLEQRRAGSRRPAYAEEGQSA